MLKDLGLAVQAAHSVKASLPLGGPAMQLYTLLSAHGRGSLDFSCVYEYLQKQAAAGKKQ
jgi:3-hydroxyisobutyrate dehydrogenase